MKLDIRKLDAVFEKGQQASPLLGRLGVEIADKGIFQPVLINFSERRHRFGLGIGKEFQQQFPIDRKFFVVLDMAAFDVSVVLHQPLDDIVFKFQFGKNVVHLQFSSFFVAGSSLSSSFRLGNYLFFAGDVFVDQRFFICFKRFDLRLFVGDDSFNLFALIIEIVCNRLLLGKRR